MILRGGKRPNYDAESVARAAAQLDAAGLPAGLMIDFSHANSGKRPDRQAEVARDVARQVAAGDRRIFGAMIESHLKAGRQDLVPGAELVHGQSITDACLAWEETLPVLEALAAAVRERRRAAAPVAAS